MRTINLKHIAVLTLFFFNVLLSYAGGPDYYKGKGRILVSSDGNFHDEDDWAASAATLMILAKAKLQNKLVAYIYNDHIWQSSEKGLAQMAESVINGGQKFGFINTNFIQAATNPETAYNAVCDAINASTADNPLFIIAGGPMHVVGEGMNRANASALKHVTIISHSTWNDNHSDKPHRNPDKPWTYDDVVHSGWTWSELKSKFGSSVNFNHIIDQNDYESAEKGFATTKAANGGKYWDPWYWMRDHNDARVQWVYQRGVTMGRPDWSDAGMAFYLLKGYDHGGANDLKTFISDVFGDDPN